MWSLLLACETLDTGPEPTAPAPTLDTDTTGNPADTATGATGDTSTVPITKTDDTVTVGGLLFEEKLPTNLLVISLDTARRDYFGYFNGGADTPNFDAWLDGAYVLANHRSCSNWTAWSMTCVVSGRTPMANGFGPWSYGDGGIVPNFPPNGYETLQRRLTNALGWQTVLVTGNGVFSSDMGITEGFSREVRVDWTPASVVADAALDEAALVVGLSQPWYLHVHFIDPHGDYCPPDEYYDLSGYYDVGVTPEEVCYGSYNDAPYFWSESQAWQEGFVAQLQELYRGEFRYWDAEFGRFMTELEALGALDDTLVVFVTDHGQQFYERAGEGYGGHGHGIYMGPEENAATAAFWAANLTPGVWDGLTMHQDITQTLYTMYGLTPFTPIDGEIVGTGADDRVVHAMNFWGSNPLLSVSQGDHHLVYDWFGGRHFYRLDDDPEGLVDVYDANDPDVVALWDGMSDWIDVVQSFWPFLGEPAAEGP